MNPIFGAPTNKNSPKIGASCTLVNQSLVVNQIKIICVRVKNKLFWQPAKLPMPAASQTPLPAASQTPLPSSSISAGNIALISSSLYAVRCGDNPNSSTLTTGVAVQVDFTNDIKSQGFIGAVVTSGLLKSDCDKAGTLKVIQNFTQFDAKWVSWDSNGLGLIGIKKAISPINFSPTLPSLNSKMFAFSATDRGSQFSTGSYAGINGEPSQIDANFKFNFDYPESLNGYAIFNSDGLLISISGHPLAWFCGVVLTCSTTSNFLNFLPNARKIQTPALQPKTNSISSPIITNVNVSDSTLEIIFKPSLSTDKSLVTSYAISLSANGKSLVRNFKFPDQVDENGDGTYTYLFDIDLDTFHKDFGYTGTAPNFTLRLSGYLKSISSPSASWNLGLSAYEQFNA